MEWDWVENNWDEVKDKAKQQWESLSDAQLEQTRGQRDSLLKEIEDMYGISRHAAEWQLSGWQQRLKT